MNPSPDSFSRTVPRTRRGAALAAAWWLMLPAAALAQADFGALPASSVVRQVADWVVRSGDHQTAPFAIIDKTAASLYVFNGAGRLQGRSAILLGQARGDHSVPGIGARPMRAIAPHERTTPAGRFRVEPGRNQNGEDILWVDYDAAVSLHRVRTANKKERRLERLATPTVADNRISWGCINVPASFYDRQVRDAFARGTGMVYILPEELSLTQVFPAMAVTPRVAGLPATP